MAKTYEKNRQRQHNLYYTVATAVLICVIFLGMVVSFYVQAEEDAYEMLHLQTKQIKDDITLQLKSDRENLATLADFAATLYTEGQGYDRMFASFNSSGMFSRIGILTPECVFIAKEGNYDLSGKISFEEQVLLGEHITGRTYSYSIPDEQVVRCAVPIKVYNRTVGILYGIIKIDRINEKYNNMAKELDAQLFVYDKETGRFVIDTISKKPGDISSLRDREYKDGYSYEQLVTTDKGYSIFKSKFTGENLYLHYSTIEDFNWGIMLGRYESQVFEETNRVLRNLLLGFLGMLLLITAYLDLMLRSEKNRTKLNQEASYIRHLLLEVNQQQENVTSALKKIKEFSKARSCFFADTDGEDYCYIKPELRETLLSDDDRKYLLSALFRFVADTHQDGAVVGLMQIVPNPHLAKTDSELYDFMTKRGIKKVSFAIITDRINHVSILGTVNPMRSAAARKLISDVAVCFSIAAYNKKHLKKTELAATTDALTGAQNRVAYNKDILIFDEEKPEDFACLYVDVNELHIRNNKYGHAAGDEMLIYIANSLKECFFGHHIYRMGGDEFLVFTKGISQETVKQNMEAFVAMLKPKDYHVAIGMSYRSQNTNCDEMVREAELKMYEAKARYYQDKKQNDVPEGAAESYVQVKTGIREIDTMISVLKEHYNGIYRVSLESDNARRILMPAYLGYNENEGNFSKLLAKYIADTVHPDYRRSAMSFLNYDAIKRQIADGKTPSITYKKMSGETVILSVYNLNEDKESANDTLWVFAKD